MATNLEERAAHAAYMRSYRQANLGQERERDKRKYARQRQDAAFMEHARERGRRYREAKKTAPHVDCSVAGCSKMAMTRGFCNSHYLRLLRHGDPLVGRTAEIRGDIAARLWPRIAVGAETDCWEWQAARSPAGYGVIGRTDGGSRLAHRIAWELINGEVPEGLDLDHLCRNRACCNPAHLEPVTHTENMRRAMRTQCPQGHEFTVENTRIEGDGTRRCRICDKTQQREKYLRRKARGVA